jgi:IPT/TIG domain
MREVPMRGRMASVTLAGLLLAAMMLASSAQAVRAAGCTVAQCPTITSLSQGAGPNTGGTAVTVTGTRFVTGATVYFGANSAVTAFVNSTTLTTTTPSIAPGGWGALFVSVRNLDGGISQEVVTFT